MPEPNVRVKKRAENTGQAARSACANNVRAVEDDAVRRQFDMETRRAALALAIAIGRQYGLDTCPTCGRKAA